MVGVCVELEGGFPSIMYIHISSLHACTYRIEFTGTLVTFYADVQSLGFAERLSLFICSIFLFQLPHHISLRLDYLIVWISGAPVFSLLLKTRCRLPII